MNQREDEEIENKMRQRPRGWRPAGIKGISTQKRGE